MDEEQFYSYPGNSSNSIFGGYDERTQENNRYSKTNASSWKTTENRNGVVRRPQNKHMMRLKRCPSLLLGRPLEDYDCSDQHDVSVLHQHFSYL